MRDIHAAWGWVAIVANALAGLYALAAWQWTRLRGRWVWIATIAAEVAMLLQVGMGVWLVTIDEYEVENFDIHAFYGFVSFATIGGVYGYKYVWKARGWMELAYGLVGLFIMGLGLRAVAELP